MAKVIDRFEFFSDEGSGRESAYMMIDSQGEYVKHEDHINMVAVLNAEIETLKAQLKLAGAQGSIATGHAILKAHISNDEGYAWAWQSNIACTIMDALKKEIHTFGGHTAHGDAHRFANETTVQIMKNIFDFDSSQLASYKAFGYNDDSDNAQSELPV